MSVFKSLAEESKKYQAVTDTRLPGDAYCILQLDGNAFHTFTRGMEKPFDSRFIAAMNETAKTVAGMVSNLRFGFVQSDEMSFLIKTREPVNGNDPQPWFNHRIEKVVSLTAAAASVAFSRLYPEKQPALFDARFFSVPTKETALKHILWRQQDCTKNSILTVGQSVFSHKQLQNKNTLQVREMLVEANQPWEAYAQELKFGRVISRVPVTRKVEFVHKRTGEKQIIVQDTTEWAAVPAPKFEKLEMFEQFLA